MAKYRVDATDGRNGGAQRTLWEIDGGTLSGKGQRQKIKAVALVLDLAKSSAFLWSWLGRQRFPREDLEGAVRLL